MPCDSLLVSRRNQSRATSRDSRLARIIRHFCGIRLSINRPARRFLMRFQGVTRPKFCEFCRDYALLLAAASLARHPRFSSDLPAPLANFRCCNICCSDSITATDVAITFPAAFEKRLIFPLPLLGCKCNHPLTTPSLRSCNGGSGGGGGQWSAPAARGPNLCGGLTCGLFSGALIGYYCRSDKTWI